jgi:hypothetical protein
MTGGLSTAGASGGTLNAQGVADAHALPALADLNDEVRIVALEGSHRNSSQLRRLRQRRDPQELDL